MKGRAAAPQDYLSLVEPSPNELKSVTAVLCARNIESGLGQAKLDLTLASLAAQDYPESLLSVIVVDDGSPVPVQLPDIKPDQVALVRLDDEPARWGKSRAANTGASLAQSELLFFLDTDMILERSHVSRLAAWAASDARVVAFGYKQICSSLESTPEEVFEAVRRGDHGTLPVGDTHRHAWLEDYVDSTARLRAAGADVFRAITGSTLMLSSSLWSSSGGYDEFMVTAEDTELGYRLCQRGALVVPVPEAQAWHVGETTMSLHRETMIEHNRNLLAPRVPLLEYLRSSTVTWKVPTLVTDVFVDSNTASPAVGLIEALLSGKLGVDTRVRIVCSEPESSRYSPVSDDSAALRSLLRRFEFDPRVETASTALEDPFPTPFYAAIPGNIPLSGLRRMLDQLRQRQVGVVAVAMPEDASYPCVIWRTAALGRAGLAGTCVSGEGLDVRPLVAQVARVWGFWWMDPPSVGIHPGRVTYEADPVLSIPGGAPAVYYMLSAWSAWSKTSFRPSSAAAISGGVVRGVGRRVRRKAKSQLQRAAAKL